jgi:hypothetical protein
MRPRSFNAKMGSLDTYKAKKFQVKRWDLWIHMKLRSFM